jgi:anti-sigma factor RsiW
MTCTEAQDLLLAHQRGTLPEDLQAEVSTHLTTCLPCAARSRAERQLSEVLEQGLPVFPASMSLKRRLADRWLSEEAAAPPPLASPLPRRPRRTGWVVAGAGLVAAAAVALLLFTRPPAGNPLVAEAINDHLRLLDGERPLQVRSTDLHQIKPWFAGHLDLAPAVTFTGDADFALEGGAVSRFLDTRAASILFKRRQHMISLFIVHATDAGWAKVKERPSTALGRGFNVMLWRGPDPDLGYALVSDVDEHELAELQRRIVNAR